MHRDQSCSAPASCSKLSTFLVCFTALGAGAGRKAARDKRERQSLPPERSQTQQTRCNMRRKRAAGQRGCHKNGMFWSLSAVGINHRPPLHLAQTKPPRGPSPGQMAPKMGLWVLGTQRGCRHRGLAVHGSVAEPGMGSCPPKALVERLFLSSALLPKILQA